MNSDFLQVLIKEFFNNFLGTSRLHRFYKSPPVIPTNAAIQAVFRDSCFRRNDREGCIVCCDLPGLIGRQKVFIRSGRFFTDRAARLESMAPATP